MYEYESLRSDSTTMVTGDSLAGNLAGSAGEIAGSSNGSRAYSPGTFDTLSYPDDMGGNEFYPDCIKFSIGQRLGIKIQDIVDSGVEGWRTGEKLFKEGVRNGKANTEAELMATHLPAPLKRKIMREHHASGGWLSDKRSIESITATAIDEWNNRDLQPIEVVLPDGTKVTKTEPRQKVDKNLLDVVGRSMRKFGASMSSKKRMLNEQPQQVTPIGSIFMNMPNSIQFNETANWGGDSLGFMGKAVKDFVGGTAPGDPGAGQIALGKVVGSAGDIAGASIGVIPSLVSKLGIPGGMMGGAIGAIALGGPMQKGFESALGITQNPYMEMMFSGIGFRKFTFDFIMRPKSAKEVRDVVEILKQFRTHSKPSYTQQGLGNSFMDYPMEFNIEFLTWKSGSWNRNTHIPLLKPCVCDSVTSNYTPQSIWASYQDGAPVAIQLGLSFQESELVMASDVRDKGY